MANRYDELKQELESEPRRWLVTGVAGFIGSNILERLLSLGQEVVGLDNFDTGHQHNLDEVRDSVPAAVWSRFRFVEGDISNPADTGNACDGVQIVLHQAALGSVPRSIEDPVNTNRANIDGFVQMLVSARDAGAARFVYAASSSTYGDHPGLPKVEDEIGKPLSPYAVTKRVNELYADVFSACYGMETIGLRYFNVYGPHQDPDGAYAAVIPKWVASLLRHQTCAIHGDGETSRDFCFVGDAVQANLLAGTVVESEALNQVYNVAYGERTTLNELFALIRDGLAASDPAIGEIEAKHGEFRPGDVRHSLADISKARRLLGFDATHSVRQGLAVALDWYVNNARATHPPTT